MYNRIGDSSNLLTASSQSEHGIRQNPFIYYRNYKRMKFINFSIQEKLKKMNLYRVRASVNPTTRIIRFLCLKFLRIQGNRIILNGARDSSGRIPLCILLKCYFYLSLVAIVLLYVQLTYVVGHNKTDN